MVEWLYALLYLWAIGVSLWIANRIKGFLALTPSIRHRADLDRFKDLARLNMRLALVQIGVLVLGMVLGVVILWRHGTTGLLAVLATNAILFVVGKQVSGFEKEARALSSATPELAREHRVVSDSWVKKPLPDF